MKFKRNSRIYGPATKSGEIRGNGICNIIFRKHYTTCTNKEQLCFCISIVAEILNAEETFGNINIKVGNIKSEILVTAIKDMLYLFNISIDDF